VDVIHPQPVAAYESSAVLATAVERARRAVFLVGRREIAVARGVLAAHLRTPSHYPVGCFPVGGLHGAMEAAGARGRGASMCIVALASRFGGLVRIRITAWHGKSPSILFYSGQGFDFILFYFYFEVSSSFFKTSACLRAYDLLVVVAISATYPIARLDFGRPPLDTNFH
jgi:hypothetical protein